MIIKVEWQRPAVELSAQFTLLTKHSPDLSLLHVKFYPSMVRTPSPASARVTSKLSRDFNSYVSK